MAVEMDAPSEVAKGELAVMCKGFSILWVPGMGSCFVAGFLQQ